MRDRRWTIVTAISVAITLAGLVFVVVRWPSAAEPSQAAPPPRGPAAPPHVSAPTPAVKRIRFADLVDATADRKYVSGEATVPYAWPDGYQSLWIGDALRGMVKVTTSRGVIELSDARQLRALPMELVIRAGVRLAIDYDAPHDSPTWKGTLDCAVPDAGTLYVEQFRTSPPVRELAVELHAGGVVRSAWKGVPRTIGQDGFVPVCEPHIDERARVDVKLTLPMPPVPGQRIGVGFPTQHARISINDSTALPCESLVKVVRIVAIDRVPNRPSLVTSERNTWIASRIGDSTFAVTCERSGLLFKMPQPRGPALACELGQDAIVCTPAR